MSYMVDGGTGNRPRFETLSEANRFANEIMRKTGLVLAVTENDKPANRTFK